MKAKILKTAADYEAALAYIDTLMDAAPGSPDPIDAILFRMDQ